MGGRGRVGAALAVGAIALLGACGADATLPPASPGTTTEAAAPATTAVRPSARYTASVTHEQDISGAYRQGVARVEGGWIFETNDGLYRTDEALNRTAQAEPAIPSQLTAQTYDHIGDGDVADGMLWVPVEKDDKDQGEQVLARYDANTLTFVDSFTVPQHHASFVTVGPDGTIYSTDEFSDDALQRYRLTGTTLEHLEPLRMSRSIERIQGGDVADGAVWLSTDDANDAVYRVDLQTGDVQELGSIGHVDGEGEGIDATELPSGLLHVVGVDAKLVPVRLIDLQVEVTG